MGSYLPRQEARLSSCVSYDANDKVVLGFDVMSSFLFWYSVFAKNAKCVALSVFKSRSRHSRIIGRYSKDYGQKIFAKQVRKKSIGNLTQMRAYVYYERIFVQFERESRERTNHDYPCDRKYGARCYFSIRRACGSPSTLPTRKIL